MLIVELFVDEENREKYKEDVARILHKFGSCESNFQKNIRCLSQAKNDVYGTVAAEGEDCDRETLMKDIDDIINIIEGRSKLGMILFVAPVEKKIARY